MSASAEDRVSDDGHLQTALVCIPKVLTGAFDSRLMRLTSSLQPSDDGQKTEVIKAVDELLDLITVKFSKISTEVFAKSKLET